MICRPFVDSATVRRCGPNRTAWRSRESGIGTTRARIVLTPRRRARLVLPHTRELALALDQFAARCLEQDDLAETVLYLHEAVGLWKQVVGAGLRHPQR